MKPKNKMNEKPKAEINMVLAAGAPETQTKHGHKGFGSVSDGSGLCVGATSKNIMVVYVGNEIHLETDEQTSNKLNVKLYQMEVGRDVALNVTESMFAKSKMKYTLGIFSFLYSVGNLLLARADAKAGLLPNFGLRVGTCGLAMCLCLCACGLLCAVACLA